MDLLLSALHGLPEYETILKTLRRDRAAGVSGAAVLPLMICGPGLSCAGSSVPGSSVPGSSGVSAIRRVTSAL